MREVIRGYRESIERREVNEEEIRMECGKPFLRKKREE